MSSHQWGENVNRRMIVQASLGEKRDHISKITRAKRAGGVVKVGEYLLCKSKAMSSAKIKKE
jgi:hypothetical protein